MASGSSAGGGGRTGGNCPCGLAEAEHAAAMNKVLSRTVVKNARDPGRDKVNKRARLPSSRYKAPMRRLALSLLVLGFWTTAAAAQGMPKVGDALPLTGAPGWPQQQWMYNAPSANDAAGKIVVHWFCTPRVAACTDDLARIVTMREGGGVYIVAYINGSQRDAKKVDPIRESEGVGHGTVATGAGVKKLFKQVGVAKGPAAIVVGLDGKVKAVTTSGDINELDSRDAVIKELVDSVKPFTTSNKGPTKAKVGEKMTFSFEVQLANWLTFSKSAAPMLDFQAAKEVKCEPVQITTADRTMTASVTCTAPKGSYQARGEIRFRYDSPNGATGLGNDGATWKFEVAP
jgi:hypothetical protein